MDIDALSRLPEMQYREKPYPLIGHTWGIRYENAEHKISLGKVQFIEQLGPTNFRFGYTIPFRQGISVKGYGTDLFKKLVDFKRDCDDREPGILVDPIWGAWPVVCVSFDGDTDPNRRDGVDAKVEFVYKPEIDNVIDFSLEGLQSVTQLHQDAKWMDGEATRLWHDREEEKPKAGANILDAIAGVGRQIERVGNKVSAALNGFARRCEKIEEAAKALEDPEAFGLVRAARRNRAAAHKLLKRVNNAGRDTITMTIRYTKSVVQVARESNMTVPELLELNPDFCRSPYILPGSKVRRYARA